MEAVQFSVGKLFAVLLIRTQVAQTHYMNADVTLACERCCVTNGYLQRLVWDPGGALGYFFGGYVPPGTPNWHPVLEKFSPKIDTPL